MEEVLREDREGSQTGEAGISQQTVRRGKGYMVSGKKIAGTGV
jgi:hypothetical protein